MVTELQQQIYNNHLVVSRKVKGEPFKLKKDFSKLEKEKIIALEKLEKLFSTHNNIIPEDFFMAPHKIYPDDEYYPLEFYTKPKAIKCYTQYVKALEILDPDNIESLKRLADGLKFVQNYCQNKGLELKDYELNIETDATMPCFVDHLKNHKINFYTLHALTFEKPAIDSRILEFIFPEFFTVFRKTRNKFYSSKRMKEFAKKAKTTIETKLKN